MTNQASLIWVFLYLIVFLCSVKLYYLWWAKWWALILLKNINGGQINNGNYNSKTNTGICEGGA